MHTAVPVNAASTRLAFLSSRAPAAPWQSPPPNTGWRETIWTRCWMNWTCTRRQGATDNADARLFYMPEEQKPLNRHADHQR